MDLLNMQPFDVVLDDAASVDTQAYADAAEFADYPALHPDQFKFLLPVMLEGHFRPVPCVAILAINDRGQVSIDAAWIFRPEHRYRQVKQLDDFERVKAAAFGPHLEDVMARAIEHRAAFRPRAAA